MSRWTDALGALLALTLGSAAPAGPDELALARRHSPPPPLPADPGNAVADDPRAAEFGRRLFFERRLSPGGIACATCHRPEHGLSDARPIAEGAARGRRRTPSLWNVAHNRWFFWDGRADSLWSQALVPIEGAAEMAGTRRGALAVVAGDAELRARFEALFGPLPAAGDGAATDRAFAALGKALAAYERTFVSRGGAFDRYVADRRAGRASDAITPAARRGFALFTGRARCSVCHRGPLFTDGAFHDTGVLPPPGMARDPGRYAAIGALRTSPFRRGGAFSDDHSAGAGDALAGLEAHAEDWGQVKTPGLRNVALHPPYMHQGQFATLREVVRFYSTGVREPSPDGSSEAILRPLHLSEGEIDDLVAFLESLTDDVAVDPPLQRDE